MPRTLTARTTRELFKQETSEAFLVLLTLDHTDLAEPIRVVDDHVDHYSRGNTNPVDSSANGFNGTKNNCLYTDGQAPRALDGKRGGAIQFKEDDDWLSLGDHAELKSTGAMSVEARVWVDEYNSAEMSIYANGDGNDVQFGLFIDADGKLGYEWYDGTLKTELTDAVVFSTSTWTRIAVTRSSDGQTVKFYVNGTLVKTSSVTTPTSAGGTATVGGPASDTAARRLRGRVDELRVWSTERTAEEITENQNMALVGDEDGLEGYWRFDDGDMYVAYPFELQLPDDKENAPPRARLTIDNVDRQIVQNVRQLASTPTVLMEIIAAAYPHEVEVTFPVFRFQSIRYDSLQVSGDLVLTNLASEPYPAGQFSPSQFRGIFK